VSRKLPPESFDFYVALGFGRSYKQVADHFGVSKGTVTALAQRDDWQARLTKLEQQARSRAEEKAVETLEQMNERHLKIARALQGKALESLRSMPLMDAKDVIRALDLTVRQERLIQGEPTDRMASVEEIIARETRQLLKVVDDDDAPAKAAP
jgi:hypothetical protein